LLNLLEDFKNHIEALYFPIPDQYMGSGRYMYINRRDRYNDEIPELIKRCNSLNIKSQLLLNATCVGKFGLEKKNFLKISNYIKELKNIGLKSVIISNPVYIFEVRKQVKDIEIESSINCYVKTVEHALYLKNLGVDVLTIDRDINRNIPLIKEIKKKTGLRIRMLVNEGCLRNCPFRGAHFNLISHLKEPFKTKTVSEQLFERWCIALLSRNPEKIFSIPFIPPNAIKYYTEFVDYFKISTRDSENSLIGLRLKSYINQDFNDNFRSLIDCAGLSPYIKYIDYKVLKENNFFEKMFKHTDESNNYRYYRKLVDNAVVTNSFFLNPSHPVRIRENKKAIRIYKRVLEDFPSDRNIYIELAKAYFMLEDYKEAIENAGQAIDLGYSKDDIHSLLGVCYVKIKKFNNAIVELKKAEKFTLKEAGINFMLFECYKNIGQKKQADLEFRKGILKVRKLQNKSLF